MGQPNDGRPEADFPLCAGNQPWTLMSEVRLAIIRRFYCSKISNPDLYRSLLKLEDFMTH